jgi:hypothetical protein
VTVAGSSTVTLAWAATGGPMVVVTAVTPNRPPVSMRSGDGTRNRVSRADWGSRIRATQVAASARTNAVKPAQASHTSASVPVASALRSSGRVSQDSMS